MKTLFKKLFLFSLLAVCHLLATAAEPDWNCDISAYEYDMSVFASLEIDGKTVSTEQYTLAAFCGDECRGVATVEEENTSAYYYLRIRSNSQSGETITFRAYDKVSDKEVDASWLTTTLTFETDGRKGYPSSPYVITFRDKTVYHTVTVLPSSNGSVTGGGRIEHGKEMTLTAVPNDGYEFVDWTDGATANPYTFQVTADKEIGANFTPKKFKVSYVIDGVTVLTDSVAYTSVIVPLEAPTKEGHTFGGWQNVPETMPAQDIKITGSYSVNVYAIKYYVDGEEYHTDSIAYGEAITPIAEPTKEGHKFNGWSEIPQIMPAQDVRVDGSFTVLKYKVTYIIDGKTFTTDSVTYAARVVTPEVPTKEGHTFTGWLDAPETMPAHDIEITGSYTVNIYAVKYYVDGKEYETDSIAFGGQIKPIESPTKEGYTFSGWSEIPETMPAEDVIITGSFTVNTYKVIYMIDGEVYKTVEVNYGEPIPSVEDPVKEGYTFCGWSEIPETMPANDVIINGGFEIANGIETVKIDGNTLVTIYSINGTLICRNKLYQDVLKELPKGLYIINGKKTYIK